MDKIEQLRAKLAAIVSNLEQYKNMSNVTDEDTKAIGDLHTEFQATQKEIETLEKVQDMLNAANVSKRQVPATPAAAAPRIEFGDQPANCKNLGFKGLGDFFTAVRNQSSGRPDRRFQNTHFEKNAEDGGILVPEEMSTAISKKFQDEDSLFSRTTSMPVSGNSMSLITDEQNPFTGGIQAFWTGEGENYTESKTKLGLAQWKLNKLTAFAKVTDELLEDAVGLESHLLAKAPEAIKIKMNNAIISGTGVGMPTGILGSGFKVTVAKEVGQAADTVVARNVINMYSRLPAGSLPRAVWLINVAVQPQLWGLKNDNNEFIYLSPGSQLNQTPYGRLMGLPVLPMLGAMKQLGDEGDIILVDLAYYNMIYKSSGVKQAVSTHVFFQQDIMAYKWTYRADGSCPFKSPIVPEYGTFPMSGIVTLADRA